MLEIDKNFELIGPIDSVSELKEILTGSNHYQLILADIRINGGTCFDAFDIVKPDAPVIFVTAYDEYALKAFKNNGIAYLQKPFEVDELRESINKAMKMIEPQKEMAHLISLLKDNSKKNIGRDFLCPKGSSCRLSIPTPSIILCLTEKYDSLFGGWVFCLS